MSTMLFVNNGYTQDKEDDEDCFDCECEPAWCEELDPVDLGCVNCEEEEEEEECISCSCDDVFCGPCEGGNWDCTCDNSCISQEDGPCEGDNWDCTCDNSCDEEPEPEPEPCEGDPIKNPEIAPQTNSGISGGRYGYTRSGGTKFHGGLDIKSEYGDPIYAMFDGTATSISSYYTSAGWIVYQTAVIDGESVSIQYFHLQKSGRVSGAINAGDIIGYQGDSGNLKEAIEDGYAESHLHIKMKDSNGNTINPENYLTTTFDSEGNPTTNCN
ncbi:M23 family metallopeptidase [Wenyingzhuangia sp. IMCC45533]